MATWHTPPGPRPDLLLGNLRQFRQDPLGFLTACARTYGDISRYRVLHIPVTLLSHPDDIEAVLVTNYRNFLKGGAVQAGRLLFGNGLLLSEGDFWRKQRRLAQPAFHRERISIYARSVIQYAQRMLDSWYDGGIIDVHQEMIGVTMRIAAETLFGAHLDRDVETATAALQIFFERFRKQVNTGLILSERIPTPANLQLHRVVKRLDEIIYRMIQERDTDQEDRGDLLSILLRARDEDGNRMTALQLRDEVITLFIGGHETTSLALTWTWYLLGQHPEAEARLAAELEMVLGGRLPGPSDLGQLPYAERVVKEAMRLYPPAWVLTRKAIVDCEIGGYRVPAGTSLAMSQWVVHRDPRYFESPHQFNPDRWTGEFEKQLPRFAYFPFGGGPRVCIGSSFALMEIALILACVAGQYRLSLAPGHSVDAWPTLGLRPRYGMQMVLERR